MRKCMRCGTVSESLLRNAWCPGNPSNPKRPEDKVPHDVWTKDPIGQPLDGEGGS